MISVCQEDTGPNCLLRNEPRRFTWEDPDDVVVAEDVLRQAGLHAAADRLRDAIKHRRAGGRVGAGSDPYDWRWDEQGFEWRVASGGFVVPEGEPTIQYAGSPDDEHPDAPVGRLMTYHQWVEFNR